MRIVVVSDSHRRMGNLFDIIEMHKDSAELFIFLGDMDNDFDEILMVYPNLRYMRVAGNNDWSSRHPLFREIMLSGKRIYFCHGHTHHVKHGYQDIINHCKNIKADICLFGHTHMQFTDYDDGLYIMNPGAVIKGEYGMIDITDSGIMLLPSKI